MLWDSTDSDFTTCCLTPWNDDAATWHPRHPDRGVSNRQQVRWHPQYHQNSTRQSGVSSAKKAAEKSPVVTEVTDLTEVANLVTKSSQRNWTSFPFRKCFCSAHLLTSRQNTRLNRPASGFHFSSLLSLSLSYIYVCVCVCVYIYIYIHTPSKLSLSVAD